MLKIDLFSYMHPNSNRYCVYNRMCNTLKEVDAQYKALLELSLIYYRNHRRFSPKSEFSGYILGMAINLFQVS